MSRTKPTNRERQVSPYSCSAGPAAVIMPVLVSSGQRLRPLLRDCGGCFGLALSIVVVLGSLSGAHADMTREEAETMNQQRQAALDLHRVWQFDEDRAGDSPRGFTAFTVGGSRQGSWQVKSDPRAPSAPQSLVQRAPCDGEGCLHLLLADGLAYDYLDLSFRLRSQSESSQGIAGAVFAVKDAKNFYAVLVDLSNDTLSVVRVLDGEETVLGRAQVTRKPLKWHQIRVQRNTIVSKEFIETFFDHKLAVSVHDGALRKGQIGLVASGDVPVKFDNLNVIRLYSQRVWSAPAAY